MPLHPPSRRPDADFWSLRFVEETSQSFAVRKNVAQPFVASTDRGVDGDGLRRRRLRLRGDRRHVRRRASPRRSSAPRTWARATARHALFDSRIAAAARCRAATTRRRRSTAPLPSRREWYELLHAESAAAGVDPRIVDWEAGDRGARRRRIAWSRAGRRRRAAIPLPDSAARRSPRTRTASRRPRSLNGYRGICQQGGVEMLDALRLRRRGAARRRGGARAARRARTARRGTMDVLLAPDQMVLQIHESIGHPLELDRILGDERNFAGTSFVTPDMFGSYRYGSEPAQRHVRPDPARGARELRASTTRARRAEKAYLIRDGILERPLGGAISQARARPARRRQRARRQLEPSADRPHGQSQPRAGRRVVRRDGRRHRARRAAWRPTASWSIDDSRNKFQFGCERGADDRERQARGTSSRTRTTAASPRASGAAWRAVGNAETRAGAGHAVLRQGRAVAGDPRRPRVARLRVHRRRRVRRENELTARCEQYFERRWPASPCRSRWRRRRALHAPSFDAEDTDFVRMNRGKVRQPGTVSQRYLSVAADRGARHAEHSLSLSGDSRPTTPRCAMPSPSCATALPDLAEDPHLLLPADVSVSRDRCARRRCRRPRRWSTRCCARPTASTSSASTRAGPDLPRLRQLRGPAQLARDDGVQSAMEPLSPRRQGGEVRPTPASHGTRGASRARWRRRASASR